MSVKGPGWRAQSKPKKITAQYDSRCPDCHDEILTGDTIWWSDWYDAYVCEGCGRD